MADIRNIQGISAVLKRFQDRKSMFSKPQPVVRVGYTQSYAVYVHENLEAHHPNGQAKFLEQPLRTMKDELAGIVVDTMKSGGSLEEGMILAGLRLQSASQELVPVDTGALRRSAFTRLE